MKTIASTFTGTLVATTFTKREPTFLSNVENFLAEFVITEGVHVRSTDISVLPAKEITDRKGEVTRLPATASVQLYRGFLRLNDTGSIYYYNNNKSYRIGYVNINVDGTYKFDVKNKDLLDNIATQKELD